MATVSADHNDSGNSKTRIKRTRLDTGSQIVREIARMYREGRAEIITIDQMKAYVSVLNILAEAKRTNELDSEMLELKDLLKAAKG